MNNCCVCNGPLPKINLRFCNNPECQEEKYKRWEIKAKEKYDRTYIKRKNFCPTCNIEITYLWPQRTCNKLMM